MEIDYTAEMLDEDFHVGNGVSYTIDNSVLILMAFVTINSAWKINGLSTENQGDTLLVSVLADGEVLGPEKVQYKITAKIEPVPNDWQGSVNIVVKEPDCS
jgi:hypothetical protein